MTKPKVIFFGNGPLADFTYESLSKSFDIIFHARKKEDLETVKSLKMKHKDAYGILASFGVIIKNDVLELFEPEGILNIHPSALPDLRGPSPIESAILRGDSDFSVSIMKLAPEMDAGPLYYQKTLDFCPLDPLKATPEDKLKVYEALAKTGANWLVERLENLPKPTPQDSKKATFCQKLDKSMSDLDPTKKSASELLREIIAFAGFPKSKYDFFGQTCIIHSAHIAPNPTSALNPTVPRGATPSAVDASSPLSIKCFDGSILYIDELQPLGKRKMDAKSFLNGYGPKK